MMSLGSKLYIIADRKSFNNNKFSHVSKKELVLFKINGHSPVRSTKVQNKESE